MHCPLAQVFTVKMAEEDFEALEDNQVLVQGMMANRYMNTFRDDILGWNKKLMNVADVNQIITEIQRTWAYLESLFIHSEEVGGSHFYPHYTGPQPCNYPCTFIIVPSAEYPFPHLVHPPLTRLGAVANC